MERKVYYPWIDWTKFIGIYLVIMGHGWLLDERWKMFIYAFHMPFFFLISGLLFKYRPLPKLLKNDWHRLIVPYLLMNMFFLLRNLIGPIIHGSLSFDYFFSRLGAIILGIGYPTHGFIPVCDTCWFIIALFIMHILVTVCQTGKQRINWMIIIACIAVAVILQTLNIIFLTSVNSALLAVPFFYLGICSNSLIDSIGSSRYAVVKVIVGVGLLVLTWFLSGFNGRVDVDLCKWGDNLLVFYLIALVGSVGIIMVGSVFGRAGVFVKTISKGTIFILGFNLYFIDICKKLVDFYSNYHHNNVFGFFWGMVILLVSFFLILFLQRYFPIVLGNRK